MITSPAFAGRRYAVLGLARSGLATVRALHASGAELLAWDDREEAREALRAEFPAGVRLVDLNDADLSGVEAIIVSPGIAPARHPIGERSRAADVPLIGDIELFARARPFLPPHQVIGITGTNGKSTTTALVRHLLGEVGRAATMGGNIGLPILGQDPLEPSPLGPGVYVLELSSYQIDLTFSLSCEVAVLLNISPDHLDRYGDVEAYARSKARLFEMQGPESRAIVTGGDRWSRALATRLGERLLIPAEVDSAAQSHWPSLQGPHNLQNVAAALAAVGAVGVDEKEAAKALASYPALPHRMEMVAERNGVRFVNDSKATNPESTAPALAAFEGVHWIVGGLAKGETLGPCEARLDRVRAAYTIGEAGPMFARLLKGKVPVRQCEMLVEAVQCAARAAAPGEVVLLSPACASFDQFKDFEARGEAFRAAVEALA